MNAARADMYDGPRVSRARCWLVVVEDLDDEDHPVDILGPTTVKVARSIADRIERVVDELGVRDNYCIEVRDLSGHDADEVEDRIREKWETDDVDHPDDDG